MLIGINDVHIIDLFVASKKLQIPDLFVTIFNLLSNPIKNPFNLKNIIFTHGKKILHISIIILKIIINYDVLNNFSFNKKYLLLPNTIILLYLHNEKICGNEKIKFLLLLKKDNITRFTDLKEQIHPKMLSVTDFIKKIDQIKLIFDDDQIIEILHMHVIKTITPALMDY
jgi:hypothetical protein